MEALSTFHHRHQPLCSTVHSSLTSTTASSLFLSQPSSSSIRASSTSSPSPPHSSPEPKTSQFFNALPKVPSFDPPLHDPQSKSPQFVNPIPKVASFNPSLQDPKSKSPQFLDPNPKVPSFNPIPKVASFNPSLQDPKSKSPQFLDPNPKVPSFNPSCQDPQPKSPQFLNPNPKIPSFNPSLQDPNSKSPQFLNPNPKVPSFDPSLQDPQLRFSHFLNPFAKVPSFATLTAAASAFLFLGYCQNGFHNPITTLSSSVVSIEETIDEKNEVEEHLGYHIQSVLHLKLKERVPVVHSFKKTKSDDEEAWQGLKAQVFSCSENLELVKVGFEEILEKDLDCNKVHQDRVLEYLEVVDECNGLLKGVKVAMDRCEKGNTDMKRCLRFFTKVVARVRVLEGDMVGALKYFKDIEQE